MFGLVTKKAVAQRAVLIRQDMLLLNTQRHFALFGIFKGKEEKKTQEKTVEEPTKYHKQTVQKSEAEEEVDIKQKIRQLDRSTEDNLYGKYKRQRKTLKERNT